MGLRKTDAALLAAMLVVGEAPVENEPSSIRAFSLRCSRLIAMAIVGSSDQSEIEANAGVARVTGHLAPEVSRTLLDELDAHENTWKPATILAVARAAERLLILSDRDVPCLMFRAIKEQASALKLLGRFGESLREADRAEAEAARTAAAEFNTAIARYCRAFILCEIGRTLEAAAILAETREVFARHGDVNRTEKTVTFEATILYREKRYREAMALFHCALMAATKRGDTHRAALELGHIGHCYTRLGDLKYAREYLSAASDMYRSLGMPVLRARVHRSLARVAIRETGRRSRFEEAAATFDSLGMIGEWSLTLLALAEELKMINSRADVSGICRQVYVRASRAGMVVTAAEALAMLADGHRSMDATADTVRTVAATIDPTAMEMQSFAVN